MLIVLAIAVIGFAMATMGIAIWASRRVHTVEDFVVAGRNLSFVMTTGSLIATWFGAGALLVAADEIALDGLPAAALEPIGSGVCLLLAGMFFSRRLWNEKLLTINDFYAKKYGQRASLLAAVYDVSFITWVATQFLALAGIFQVFFGIPISVGVVIVAAFLVTYTLIGGMWSVAITDFAQLIFLAIGLLFLTWTMLAETGEGSLLGGLNAIIASNSSERLAVIPTSSALELFGWFGLLAAASLGNLSGQDLMQRVFAAKSADVAVRASYVSGILYLIMGICPILFGLGAGLILGEGAHEAVIAGIAERLLSPAAVVVFTLMVMATVMSSVDSGLLAPASVFAINVAPQSVRDRIPPLMLIRLSVALCGILAVVVALSGLSGFELLEGSYSAGLTPFVVLALGVYRKKDPAAAGVWTLGFGLVLWLGEMMLAVVIPDFDLDAYLPLPSSLIILVVSIVLYFAICAVVRIRELGKQ